MSWSTGLIVWLIGGGVVCWAVALILERVGPADNTDHDWLADYKRRLARNAERERWGGRP